MSLTAYRNVIVVRFEMIRATFKAQVNTTRKLCYRKDDRAMRAIEVDR